MKDSLIQSKEDEKKSISNDSVNQQPITAGFEDNSPEAIKMRDFQSKVDGGEEMQELGNYQDKISEGSSDGGDAKTEEEYNTLVKELFSEVDMDAPKVEYTEEQNLSSVHYDLEQDKIVVNKKENMTKTELWDNIAFEAGNAVNKELFVHATKLKGQSGATPMEYGAAMGQAEFKAMLSYLKLIEKVSKKGITLPARADKALKVYTENKENFEEFFLGSAQNTESKEGKGTLSTVELHAYECVEGLSVRDCNSKFSDVLKKAKYSLKEEPAQAFRKKLEKEWKSAKSKEKPFLYSELITEALESLMDAKKGLKKLELSSKSKKVAKELRK